MRITTVHKVEPNHMDATRGRLAVEVFVNEESIGSIVALSGPLKDIEDFASGKVTMSEVRARWNRR